MSYCIVFSMIRNSFRGITFFFRGIHFLQCSYQRKSACQLLDNFLAGSGIGFDISTCVLLCYFLQRAQGVLTADRNVWCQVLSYHSFWHFLRHIYLYNVVDFLYSLDRWFGVTVVFFIEKQRDRDIEVSRSKKRLTHSYLLPLLRFHRNARTKLSIQCCLSRPPFLPV